MRLDFVKQELGKHWSGYGQAIRAALANDNRLLTKLNEYIIDTALGDKQVEQVRKQGKVIRWF
jgi:uncharacterized protein (DUF2164 family)